MSEQRVEHRFAGIIGRVVLDHHPKSAVVEWEDNGVRSVEDWKHLIRVEDLQLPESGVVVQGIEFPPGMPRDSDMGCTE